MEAPIILKKTCLSVILFLCSALVYAQTADEYITKGNEASDKEEYDLAINLYSQAINKEPSRAAYFNRGRALFYKQQFDSAIADFGRALNLDPNQLNSYFFRGIVYSQKNQYEPAIADFTQALRINPQYKDAIFQRGQAYLLSNQFKLAIDDLTTFILIDPKNTDGYIYRGLAYKEDNNYDYAIRDFGQALLLDPKSTYAYDCKGNTYKDAGMYAEAVEFFKKAIALDEKYAAAYINVMEPLARLGQFDDAANYYKTYTNKGLTSYIDEETNTTYYFRFYIKAIIAVSEKKYKECLDLIGEGEKRYTGKNDAGRVQKNNLAAMLSLKGYALEQLGRFDEAKQTYEQAILINSEQIEVSAALANLEKKIAQKSLTDRIPPLIELITPEVTRNFSIEEDNPVTQIVGKARDESGIATVQINGKDADKVEEDGLFISHLTLKPGQNSFVVSAVDKQGNKSETNFIINGSLAVKGKAQNVDIPLVADVTSKYYAILIAEKDYIDGTIPDLQNPVKDARELKDIIETRYNFEEGNIDTLFNRTRDDIMQVIVQRCNTLTKNDNLLIFYAGHGTAVKDKYGDVDGYWIPVSAKKGLTSSYISAEDINKALKQSQAKHILLIADACYSGAFTRDIGKAAPKSIQKQYKVPSRKIMASGNLEPVPDNSKFLYHLKKALKENSEKYVSAKKLFDSFYDAILNNSDNLPQYAAIKNVGDEGGEFVFIRK